MLRLSNNFINDIEAQSTTSINPLIVIGWSSVEALNSGYIQDGILDGAILVGTSREQFDSPTTTNEKYLWEDYDLKIPNIKESIDFESRKFKISKVTITLSNYEGLTEKLNSMRLLEDYGYSIMNLSVAIFYKTPSCENLDDCLKVYEGAIRRFEHDDKIIKLSIEDNVESKLTKNIPIANLGVGERSYNENYNNKPIPIVYGEVPRAPAVIWADGHNKNFKVIADDTQNTERNISIKTATDGKGLLIYKGEYLFLKQRSNSHLVFDWDQTDYSNLQWTRDSNYYELPVEYDGNIPRNTIAHNQAQVAMYRHPISSELINADNEDPFGFDASWDWLTEEDGLSFANKQSLIDDYYSSNIFGLLGKYTYARLPNNEVSSYEEFDLEPTVDYSMDLNLNNLNGGNFLEFSPRFRNAMELTDGNGGNVAWKLGEDFISATPNNIQNLEGSNSGNEFIEGTTYEDMVYVDDYCETEKHREVIDIWGGISSTTYTYYDTFFKSKIISHYKFNNLHTLNLALIQLPNIQTLETKLHELTGKMYTHSFSNCTSKGEMYDRYDYNQSSGTNNYYEYTTSFQGSMGYPSDRGTATDNFGNFDSNTYNIGGTQDDVYILWIESVLPSGTPYWCFRYDDGDAPKYHILVWDKNEYDEPQIHDVPLSYNSANNPFGADTHNPNLGFQGYEFKSIVDLDINFNDLCVYIPTNKVSSNVITPTVECSAYVMNNNSSWINEAYWTGSLYNGELQTTYDCIWNGVAPDNPNLGISGNYASYSNEYGGLDGAPYDSGIGRWYGLCLRGTNHTKENTLIPMAFSKDNISCGAVDNINIDYSTHTATLEGGYVEGSVTNDTFSISTGSTNSDGQRFGIRLGLDDVQIDDLIDLSARHQHQGRLEIYIDTEGTTNTALASLAIYNACVDFGDETDMQLRSKNSVKSYPYTQLLSDQGDEEFVTIDNISSLGNLVTDHPSGWDNTFVHGSSDSNWIKWNSPNMYSSYMWLIVPEGDSYPFQASYKFYESKVYMECEVTNLTKSTFYLNCHGRTTVSGSVMTNPAIIIQDIIQTELNLGDFVVLNELSKAQNATLNYALGFSIPKTINSKKLIEEICSNTPIFPRIKDQSSLGFAVLLNEYNDQSVDFTINEKNIISYSVSRTKLELVKSKVNVLYEKDYAESDKYVKNTGWLSAKDVFGDGDLGYDNGYSNKFYNNQFNNDNEEDTTMTFKSDFITKEATAKEFRTFLCMWYCNQHNIFKLKVNLRHMHLEVGDVVKFDKMMGNQKLYGEDYTLENRRNGQIIYPYFMIQSVSKSSNEVNLELIQLHKLSISNEFQNQIGDINRDGVVDLNDFELISDYVENKSEHYTNQQILNMDINGDQTISYSDVLLMAEQLGVDIEE